jgi:hypothetical protein
MLELHLIPDRKPVLAVAAMFVLSCLAINVADARGGGGGMRGGGGGGFQGGGGRAAATSIQRPSGGGSFNGGGNVNHNFNSNTNVNANRNVNANVNRNVNVNVDNNWNHGCCGYGGGGIYHPVAAGVAVGMVAGATAAAIGSSYYALPPSCSPYAGSYYYCGGAYYQPRYEGSTVTYIVVEKPS